MKLNFDVTLNEIKKKNVEELEIQDYQYQIVLNYCRLLFGSEQVEHNLEERKIIIDSTIPIIINYSFNERKMYITFLPNADINLFKDDNSNFKFYYYNSNKSIRIFNMKYVCDLLFNIKNLINTFQYIEG